MYLRDERAAEEEGDVFRAANADGRGRGRTFKGERRRRRRRRRRGCV